MAGLNEKYVPCKYCRRAGWIDGIRAYDCINTANDCVHGCKFKCNKIPVGIKRRNKMEQRQIEDALEGAETFEVLNWLNAMKRKPDCTKCRYYIGYLWRSEKCRESDCIWYEIHQDSFILKKPATPEQKEKYDENQTSEG